MDDRYSSTRKIPNVCCCPSSMIPFFLSVLLEQRSRERNGRDGLGWTNIASNQNQSLPHFPFFGQMCGQERGSDQRSWPMSRSLGKRMLTRPWRHVSLLCGRQVVFNISSKRRQSDPPLNAHEAFIDWWISVSSSSRLPRGA